MTDPFAGHDEEFEDSSLAGVIEKFQRAFPPAVQWRPRRLLGTPRRRAKICAPRSHRDDALRDAARLQARLRGSWSVSVGSSPAWASADRPFVILTSVEPTVAPAPVALPHWVPRWVLQAVRALTGHPSLVEEQPVPEREVLDAAVAAIRRALAEQRPPMGQFVTRVELRHSLASWGPPLQALAPKLKRRLLARQPPLLADDAVVMGTYVVESLGADELAEFDRYQVVARLTFAPADLSTRPPAFDDEVGTLPPGGAVMVKLTKRGGKTVTGEIPLDADGMLVIQRARSTPLLNLLAEVGAVEQVSRQAANALHLGIRDRHAEVIAPGGPGWFLDEAGRALAAGTRLLLPAVIQCNRDLLVEVAQA